MKIILSIFIALVLAVFGGPAVAEEADERNIVINYTVNVSDSSRPAFEAGIQKWNACFQEHSEDPDDRWYAFTAVSGDLLVYNFRSSPRKWASLDEQDPSQEACEETFLNDVAPHANKVRGSIDRFVPEFSHWNDPEPDVVMVFALVLEDGYAFRQAHRRIVEAARQQDWDVNFATLAVDAAGRGAPDMLIVVPHENFASLDRQRTPLWEMVTAAFGEDEAARVREQLNGSIRESWTTVHRRAPNLDFRPATD